VRELDDDGPLNYAPKKPRRPEQDQNPDRAGPEVVHPAPPPNMPESSEPPWKQKKQRVAFAGDTATGELRTRLTLVPDRIPEPQSAHPAVSVFGIMRPLAGVIVVVAAVIVGYRSGSAPQITPPSQQLAPASDHADFTPGLAVSTTDLKVPNQDVRPTAAPPTARGGANKASADAAQAASRSPHAKVRK
jgi:hypothetical protein